MAAARSGIVVRRQRIATLAATLAGALLAGNPPTTRAADAGPAPLAAAVTYSAPTAVAPLATTASFCAAVQQLLAGTHLAVANQVHTSEPAFVKSKPAVRPLSSHQYVLYDGDGRSPLRVSCKTKSADHIAAVYGPGALDAAAHVASCRELNRRTILAVWNALGPAQRAAAAQPPQRILLEGDLLEYLGARWLEPFPLAWTGADGRLHVQAKALHADWNDWRWKFMPERFRGMRYCHLLAPEYARRLMLGEARAPPAAASE